MVKKFTPYKFKTKLVEGIIIKRVFNYIMLVKYNNQTIRCHCPTTCSIGNFSLKNLPCLLSITDDAKRKTKYTVEAVSLDNPNKKNKKWIGINQTKANMYFEYFLRQNRFTEIFPKINKIEREKFFKNSKFDFKVDDTFLEVKTPLQILFMDIPKNIKVKKTKFSYGTRYLKHLEELKKYLILKKRAVLVFCYMYDATLDRNFTQEDKEKYDKNVDKVVDMCREVEKYGLESWAVTFKMNEKEIDVDQIKKKHLLDI